MQFRRTFALSAALAIPVALALPISAQWPATEKLDLDAIYRIKDEGLQRSKVMEIESYLTDVYGPRLTGSPNMKEAGGWAMKTMKDWGLTNVHEEAWPFGRGWQNQRFTANALTPRAYPLIAYPKAWTPGTNGPVTGEATIAVINEDKDFAEFKGKLRGKFVLSMAMRDVPAHFDSLGHRYSDAELAELAKQPAGGGRGRGNFAAAQEFNRKKAQFFLDEGVAGAAFEQDALAPVEAVPHGVIGRAVARERLVDREIGTGGETRVELLLQFSGGGGHVRNAPLKRLAVMQV